MFAIGGTNMARGIVLALAAFLALAFAAPAAAQEPAGPDQYLPNVPNVPNPDDGDVGDDGDAGNDEDPGNDGNDDGDESCKNPCPDGDDDEGSDDAGGSGPAAGGGGPTGEISAGASLPFTGYPLSSLALTVLILLLAGAALRLGLLARQRSQRRATPA